jgi:hypothetical protein
VEDNGRMIRIYDKGTNAEIGRITEEQLRFLQDQLEEESSTDNDYYINHATLTAFRQRGADRTLLTLLHAALGTRPDMDIRWEREED